MNKVLVLCLVVLIGGVAAVIYTRSRIQHFGEPFKGYPAVTVTELLAKPTDYVDKDIRVEAKVTRQ
jgi:hypothetical protein